MAKSIDIFVDSCAPLEDFVNELESLLGITFQRVYDNGETWHEFKDQHIVLTVGTHEYENSHNMNFQDYHYDIEVRALNIQTEEERKKWRDDFAHSVFKKLKETNNYRLMMIENLGVKLEEFDPKPPLLTHNYTKVPRQPFGGISHEPRLWNDSTI
jgi:hypothetical protein